MKDIEYIIKNYTFKSSDQRDIKHLFPYLTIDQIHDLGISINYDGIHHDPLKLTKNLILVSLQNDISFGFSHAFLRDEPVSKSVYYVVKMWNWILENGLENVEDDYKYYGLPLFKLTAIKYGFDNCIGIYTGNEDCFR